MEPKRLKNADVFDEETSQQFSVFKDLGTSEIRSKNLTEIFFRICHVHVPFWLVFKHHLYLAQNDGFLHLCFCGVYAGDMHLANSVLVGHSPA